MMAIGGVALSLSQDVRLARVLIAVIPVLAIVFFLIMRKAVPLFQVMQVKIDRLNLVLDEGLTGVRVIRAFDRAAHQSGRFDAANLDVTGTAISVNRLVALLMPAMFFMMNLTSVSIIWFGAMRIDSGEMHVGRDDGVAAVRHPDPVRRVHGHGGVRHAAARGGVGRAHQRGARRRCPRSPIPRRRRARRRHPRPRRVPGRDVPVSRRRGAGALGRVLHGAAGRGDRHHRRHGLRQVDAGRAHPALLRRQRGPRAGRRRRRQGPARRRRCAAGSATCRRRPCSSRARSPATSASAARRPPTTRCGTPPPWRRPRSSSIACPTATQSPVSQGRHEPLGRPEAAAVDRPRDGPPRRDLRVRRQLLGARLRHRRPAARRAEGRTPRTRRSSSCRSASARS